MAADKPRRQAGQGGRAGGADIRQVAAEAGVSIATVSRALRSTGPVAEAARARVLEVAARLRYSPNAPAASLRTQRSGLVGVVVPDLGNPVFGPFLRGAEATATARGYAVLVVDSGRFPATAVKALGRLRAHRVDAVVLGGVEVARRAFADLRRAGVVVVDAEHQGADARTTIAELERSGIEELCGSLAALGHRHAGFVVRHRVPSDGLRVGARRWHELRRRARQSGLEVRQVIVGASSDAAAVARVLAEHLNGPQRLTALVASNHALAPVVLGGLNAAGIAIPGDCSFVTFGDSDWTALYRPAISVVSLDLDHVARSMTAQALDLVEGRGVQPLDFDDEPARFILRESTGPPPTR